MRSRKMPASPSVIGGPVVNVRLKGTTPSEEESTPRRLGRIPAGLANADHERMQLCQGLDNNVRSRGPDIHPTIGSLVRRRYAL